MVLCVFPTSSFNMSMRAWKCTCNKLCDDAIMT